MNKKTCIFETFKDFKRICKGLFADVEDFNIGFDIMEGIYFSGINDNDVYKRLAAYYHVAPITSIHTDHFDTTGVWICYKKH